jgi:hypothetical protein
VVFYNLDNYIKITMNPEEFKRLLKEFAPKQRIIEADVVPVGPDGAKIDDPKVVKNLNMAVKTIDPSIRAKLVQMIEDPGAAKALKAPAQRAAVIGAMAIAFGISEQEFGQIVGKIKGMLKTSDSANEKSADDQA